MPPRSLSPLFVVALTMTWTTRKANKLQWRHDYFQIREPTSSASVRNPQPDASATAQVGQKMCNQLHTLSPIFPPSLCSDRPDRGCRQAKGPSGHNRAQLWREGPLPLRPSSHLAMRQRSSSQRARPLGMSTACLQRSTACWMMLTCRSAARRVPGRLLSDITAGLAVWAATGRRTSPRGV